MKNPKVYGEGLASYRQGEGLLAEAGGLCCHLGHNVLVLCDNFIKENYYPQLQASLEKNNMAAMCMDFSGECTYEESGRIYELAKNRNFNFIIGLGGGKVLDTVKIAGLQLKLPWVLIATSAATCAAMTAVAIVYNEDGTFRDIVDTGRAPVLTLVDETSILQGRKELLVVGLGDTFAKYHEAKHVSGFKQVEKDALALGALKTSEEMYKLIKDPLTPVKGLINANIALSGFVSTTGRNATSALYAHAFANAILRVSGAKKVLHGQLAALGVVFEFVMLKKKFPDTIVYKRLGLPLKFSDLGLKPTEEDIAIMAALIKKDDSIEYFYPKVKLEKIIAGLKRLQG